jgi:hypothetical protein
MYLQPTDFQQRSQKHALEERQSPVNDAEKTEYSYAEV